jgi:F-type H+-transporting ATPase subunit b
VILIAPTSSLACEFRRKPRVQAAAPLAVAALAFAAALAVAVPVHAQTPAASEPAVTEAHETEHEESIWPFVGKIVNFAILAGAIVYLARTPLAGYIVKRRTDVRADLEAAEAMKREAAAQIAEIDARMKALPAELDALRERGRAEVAAEEQRIRELAAAERQRLLDQAAREIDQRMRLARRELLEYAADLSVGTAETRIREQITDADRARLVERYLSQVTSHE